MNKFWKIVISVLGGLSVTLLVLLIVAIKILSILFTIFVLIAFTFFIGHAIYETLNEIL